MKNRYTGILYFFFVILPLISLSQENHAQYFLDKKGEVYFSFDISSVDNLTGLVNLISVDDIKYDTIFAYANKHEFEAFLDHQVDYVVHDHPGDVDFELNMKTWDELQQKDLTGTWDFYPTYEAYVNLMYDFEQDYPDLVEIVNIGHTVDKRDMLFARISPRVTTQKPVPKFMYTSTMHGDETTGFILSLRLIHYLLDNYGKDDDVTTLMDNVEIWICPNENPDGTYTDDNSTVNGATRGNANNVDLNRNYPNPVRETTTQLQPETVAMIEFTDTMNFIMSANMHSGDELVNFPFDSWKSYENRHADHDWWEFVMYEYVDTVHKYSPSGYMTGQGDGVTHGGDWYVIYGGRQDYFNYYRSCREFTLELSIQKLLDPYMLPAHWDYNFRSLLNYIRQAKYGIHGLVYDKFTDKPIEAKITIEDYDRNNSEITTSMPYGNFNRPLPAGVYNVNFIAEGYLPKTLYGVEVIDHSTTKLNVSLDGIPVIAVYPGYLDFNVVVANRVTAGKVLIENRGTAVLEVHSLSLEGDDEFYLDIPAKSNQFSIPPGEEEIVTVFFEPATDGRYSSILHIESNDPGNPMVSVPVEGEGVEHAAIIAVSTDSISFGEVVLLEEKTELLNICNQGDLLLTIDSVDIENDQFFVQDDLPLYIDTNKCKEVAIVFKPFSEGKISSEAVFKSNAANNPDMVVLLEGTGIDTSASFIAFGYDKKPLLNVYPNPVTHNTKIWLNLNEDGVISLKVYTLNGLLVSTIFEGYLSSGEYGFLFSSIYDKLKPGIYIITLGNNEHMTYKKIVINN